MSQTGHRDCDDQGRVFRRLRELCTALAVLVAVLGVVTLINPRVRERVGEATTGVQTEGLSATSAPLGVAAQGVFSIARSYAAANPLMFSFMIVAVVMFLLMVRT